MTQQQVADATGLTSVHVNRTLKALDAEGALARNRNRFQVLDWRRLCSIADFDPAYLHAAA
jgi:CRP-like cAMP-binding protein